MKKIFLSLLLVAFISASQAQKCRAKDVPAQIRTSFNKEYPNSKKVWWGKDSGNYHVAFYDGKAPVAVTYDPTGKSVITEMQMPVEDMPQGIMEYVKKNYPGEMIIEAAKITEAGGNVTYEVQVKDLDLVFDSKGKFLQSFKL